MLALEMDGTENRARLKRVTFETMTKYKIFNSVLSNKYEIELTEK